MFVIELVYKADLKEIEIRSTSTGSPTSAS